MGIEVIKYGKRAEVLRKAIKMFLCCLGNILQGNFNL